MHPMWAPVQRCAGRSSADDGASDRWVVTTVSGEDARFHVVARAAEGHPRQTGRPERLSLPRQHTHRGFLGPSPSSSLSSTSARASRHQPGTLSRPPTAESLPCTNGTRSPLNLSRPGPVSIRCAHPWVCGRAPPCDSVVILAPVRGVVAREHAPACLDSVPPGDRGALRAEADRIKSHRRAARRPSRPMFRAAVVACT